MNRIKGKIALITGAARGIGARTAQLFADEGAFVILTDILDEEGQALANKMGNDRAVYFHLDVSNEAQWKALFEKIKAQYQRLDILFNNAGVIGVGAAWGPQNPEEMSLEDWHRIHAINLDSVFLGCKYAISLMKNHGGAIVNMSSRSGIVGVPATAAYASSKAAIRNHTKSVALYCAQKGYGIRCNSVHPGAILTALWDPMLGTDQATREQSLKKMAAGIPIGHMGEPIDVAYAVLYLASDESKYTTGAELVIDGGILAGSSASPQK
ncbi:MAG: SDR family oxidoreductase [Gammaproteobacteria bacterium]|jgi:NAD(P)-dependent dehydrogenase (short-subunit alcohol dehydrogenase family)